MNLQLCGTMILNLTSRTTELTFDQLGLLYIWRNFINPSFVFALMGLLVAASIHYGCVPGSIKSGSVGMVYDNDKGWLVHSDSESSGSIALYWFVSAYKCQEKYNICYTEYGPNPTTTHLKTPFNNMDSTSHNFCLHPWTMLNLKFNNMDSTSHNLKDDYGI